MEFILPFLRGLGTGFILSLMLGTVFFSLIQNSIQNGVKTGIFIALGVIISDIIFIGIALFGTSLIPDMERYQGVMKMIGGTILVILGVAMLFRKHYTVSYPRTKFGNAIYYITNGFTLNIINPVNFFSWLALVAYNTTMGYNIGMNVAYFIACLMAIFINEIFIAYMADKVKRFFNEKFMLWLNRITGSVFALFGLKLLLDHWL